MLNREWIVKRKRKKKPEELLLHRTRWLCSSFLRRLIQTSTITLLHHPQLSKHNLLEGVQETFYFVRRLVLQDFYAAFHLRREKQTGRVTKWLSDSDADDRVRVCVLRLSWRTCWRRRWGGRGRREWWLPPSPACRTGPCPRCWNDWNIPWQTQRVRRQGMH